MPSEWALKEAQRLYAAADPRYPNAGEIATALDAAYRRGLDEGRIEGAQVGKDDLDAARAAGEKIGRESMCRPADGYWGKSDYPPLADVPAEVITLGARQLRDTFKTENQCERALRVYSVMSAAIRQPEDQT